MRAKYSIPANTLEYEGDRFRLMDFFADYCQFSSTRGLSYPQCLDSYERKLRCKGYPIRLRFNT